MWKNNRAARAVLFKTESWNYHIYRFDEYFSIQPLIFSSVYLLWNAQTNPVAGFFFNIVKCQQDGIIAK